MLQLYEILTSWKNQLLSSVTWLLAKGFSFSQIELSPESVLRKREQVCKRAVPYCLLWPTHWVTHQHFCLIRIKSLSPAHSVMRDYIRVWIPRGEESFKTITSASFSTSLVGPLGTSRAQLWLPTSSRKPKSRGNYENTIIPTLHLLMGYPCSVRTREAS